MKTDAVRMYGAGGPDVLRFEQVDVPALRGDEIRIRQEAIGIDFIDVNQRSGAYPVPLPAILGCEAAGTVIEVGDQVSDVRPGDRVAYVSEGRGTDSNARGAYAAIRNIAARLAVPIPDAISSTTAAALMLKGLTVEMLLRRVVEVRPCDTILVHAAAGGVGSILAPWAKDIGATVIGVVSTDAKAEIARAAGCHHVIVSSREDFADRARTITAQQGVRAVYDSIGRDTFERSLASLANRGWMVLFGQASGPVPPFEPGRLGSGSLFLTRPLLFHYISARSELLAAADALFARVLSGTIRTAPPRVFPLREAAEAHRLLQERQTTGSLVLVPD